MQLAALFASAVAAWLIGMDLTTVLLCGASLPSADAAGGGSAGVLGVAAIASCTHRRAAVDPAWWGAWPH